MSLNQAYEPQNLGDSLTPTFCSHATKLVSYPLAIGYWPLIKTNFTTKTQRTRRSRGKGYLYCTLSRIEIRNGQFKDEVCRSHSVFCVFAQFRFDPVGQMMCGQHVLTLPSDASCLCGEISIHRIFTGLPVSNDSLTAKLIRSASRASSAVTSKGVPFWMH
jgi:hypothetical protein